VVELAKPPNVWCKHCRPGNGGCSIHAERPDICRDYFCGWRLSKTVGDEWYPARCRMVLSFAVINGLKTVSVTVDPSYPLTWREPPYHGQLKSMAAAGLRVHKPEDIHIVHVRVAEQVWLVLPEREVEITTVNYLIKLMAPGLWDVETFASEGAAQARVAALAGSGQPFAVALE